MPRLTRAGISSLITALALTGAAVTTPGTASAASSYCAAPGSCPVFAGPNSSYYYADIPKYSATGMLCWTDAQWYSVNYSSNRWFKVTTAYTGTTWMHSSEVYNQRTVPHC